MRFVFYLIFFFMLLSFVAAEDLSDYPMLSTPIQVVVGAQDVGIHSLVAVDVMYSLAGYDKKKIFMRLDSEVTDFSTDFVLIGNPCQNTAIAHFYPDAGCDIGAEGIYYLEQNETRVVILTALTDARLRQLGKFLRSGDLSGTFSSPFTDSVGSSRIVPVGEPVVRPDPSKSLSGSGPNDCSGCFSQGQCLTSGQVTSVQGEGYFCEGTQLKVQQGVGPCTLDAVCLSGQCDSGQCVPLDDVSLGFFGRLWYWILNLF